MKLNFALTIRVACASLALCAACTSNTTLPPSAHLGVASSGATVKNDGSKVTLTATATDVAGKPGTGSAVFTAPFGDLNGSGTPTATVTLGAAGTATVTYACSASADATNCVSGATAIVQVAWTSATSSVAVGITGNSVGPGPDGGNPGPDGGIVDGGAVAGPPFSILTVSSTPSLLGLRGSGIQEQGRTIFNVTDANGIPAGGAAVTFSENQPELVSLSATGGVTDSNGNIGVTYSSRIELGVTSIVATLTATGAQATASIAVRGAKPSAAGFYFRCDKANLPLTLTNQLATTTCTVRLSDRSGNRVGIPTRVSFATEAGSITSSATTAPFDPANPSTEGTASVTFSTDLGNGSTPADVDPLPADPAQYPSGRAAEPSVTVLQVVNNPRDQLVTIIAMTQGEEEFVDQNHNGILDNNEIFVDQGDPFIDSNDDGLYGQISDGGQFEERFCGSTDGGTCPVYNGPNGKWDSQTTIWKPTWVVFTYAASVSDKPAGVGSSPTPFMPGCADYADASPTATNNSTIVAPLFVFDRYLNTPAAGATYAATLSGNPTGIALTPVGFTTTEPDSWGAMGELGEGGTFEYRRVSTSGGPCVSTGSTPTACVDKLLFRDWDLGLRGVLQVANSTLTPVASAPKGKSSTGYGCPGAAGKDQYSDGPFSVLVTATQANNIVSHGAFNGVFATGK